MSLIYIAGPINSEDHMDRVENCEKGIVLALTIASMGHAPYCPHALALDEGEYPESRDMTEQDWLDVDLQALGRCDAVIFADGWEYSPGCAVEHAFAVDRRIPIFYSAGLLEKYLEGR